MTSTQELIGIHNDAACKSWSKYTTDIKVGKVKYLQYQVNTTYNIMHQNTTFYQSCALNKKMQFISLHWIISLVLLVSLPMEYNSLGTFLIPCLINIKADTRFEKTFKALKVTSSPQSDRVTE